MAIHHTDPEGARERAFQALSAGGAWPLRSAPETRAEGEAGLASFPCACRAWLCYIRA